MSSLAPSPEPSLNNTKAASMMPTRLDALTIAGLTGTPHGGGGGGFAGREMATPGSPAASSDATLSSIQDSSCGGGGDVGNGDGSASVLSDDLGSVTFTDDSGTAAEREREDSDSSGCDGSDGVDGVAKTGPLWDGEVKVESTAGGGGGGGGAIAAEERGQQDRGGRGPATAEAAAGGDSTGPARAARDYPTAVAGASENSGGTLLSPASHRASPSPDSSLVPPSPRKGGQQQQRRRSHQQHPDNSRAEGILGDSGINKSSNSSNNDNQRRLLRGGAGTATAVATAVSGADSGGGGICPAPPAAAAEPPSGGAVPTVTCKVLVVGNAKCGKSSIISRFVSNRFSSDYNSTVGADYAMKDVSLENGRQVRLQLWDIAGQDRFAKLTRAYFRRAKGAVVVCDVTREGTFDAIVRWKEEIDLWCQNEGCDLPVYLFANKCDLLKEVQDSFLAGARMEKTCRDAGFAGWHITSAKRGDNIDTAMTSLVKHALEAEDRRNRGPEVASPSRDGRGVVGAKRGAFRLSCEGRREGVQQAGPCCA
ncbi:unnamed protein product [Ectocarpus sp. CCAP 1310/34]|nr:unnamed protein product [Ectocarpus sp. CCAP 1310/34]